MTIEIDGRHALITHHRRSIQHAGGTRADRYKASDGNDYLQQLLFKIRHRVTMRVATRSRQSSIEPKHPVSRFDTGEW